MDWSNLKNIWTQFEPLILPFGLRVIGALLMLIIGLRVAAWCGRRVNSLSLRYNQIDDTLGTFLGSLVHWSLTAALGLAILQLFGIPATSFLAVLGAFTLAIGLALQGALSNIAAGVMIMIFRPYKLGDYIEVSGEGGSVKDINLFQTILATPDNIQILVPNSQAIAGTIRNFSGYGTRRLDLTFSIDYEDDMDQAIMLIRGLIEADKRALSQPEPLVKIAELAASSVELVSRTWVRSEHYWDLRFDMIKQVKETFDAHGITIPYPHQVEIVRHAKQS